MNRFQTCFAITLPLSLLLLASAPRGAAAEGQVEVGLFGGLHHFDGENELGIFDEPDGVATPSLKKALILGARVAYRPFWFLGVEAEAGWVPTKVKADAAANIAEEFDVQAILYRAHVIYDILPLRHRILPFLVLGAGAETTIKSDDTRIHAKDTDFVFHAGAGARFRVGDTWGFRLDGRVLMPASARSDGFEASVLDYEATLGVYKTFGATPGKKNRDPDGDGVMGAADKCPHSPEDKDGDRDDDGCPDEDQAVAAADGDGDGVPDDKDECPDAAEDKDGDRDDDGCPDLDQDGDGIDDDKDKCPGEPETVNQFEDSDGCPDEVPQAVKQFTGTIKGIQFKVGSAELTKSSFPVLDQAAKVLTDYPAVQLNIQGHTDSSGQDAFNLTLSQQRADAVATYLEGKGVAKDRMTAKGFGSENPVADNKTSAGRRQNRRVDFQVSQP